MFEFIPFLSLGFCGVAFVQNVDDCWWVVIAMAADGKCNSSDFVFVCQLDIDQGVW